jgi:hypothetical protein
MVPRRASRTLASLASDSPPRWSLRRAPARGHRRLAALARDGECAGRTTLAGRCALGDAHVTACRSYRSSRLGRSASRPRRGPHKRAALAIRSRPRAYQGRTPSGGHRARACAREHGRPRAAIPAPSPGRAALARLALERPARARVRPGSCERQPAAADEGNDRSHAAPGLRTTADRLRVWVVSLCPATGITNTLVRAIGQLAPSDSPPRASRYASKAAPSALRPGGPSTTPSGFPVPSCRHAPTDLAPSRLVVTGRGRRRRVQQTKPPDRFVTPLLPC